MKTICLGWFLVLSFEILKNNNQILVFQFQFQNFFKPTFNQFQNKLILKVSYRIIISLRVLLCGDDDNGDGGDVSRSSGSRNTNGGRGGSGDSGGGDGSDVGGGSCDDVGGGYGGSDGDSGGGGDNAGGNGDGDEDGGGGGSGAGSCGGDNDGGVAVVAMMKVVLVVGTKKSQRQMWVCFLKLETKFTTFFSWF